MKQLTKETAFENLQDFFVTNKPFVLFGTGASCAVDPGFSMQSLQKHLQSAIPANKLSKKQKEEWNSVQRSLDEGTDLESSLNNVQNDDLIKLIISHIAEYIRKLDCNRSLSILSGKIKWPLIFLLTRLVKTLPESDRALHVATTNYDLLAEYAFEQADIPYITGFTGGISRKLDWETAKRSMRMVEDVPVGKRYKKMLKEKKHIRFYKVHGSLNTFKISTRIIENNAWVYNPPSEVSRFIITPGIKKYELLHNNRFESLHEYDEAIQSHSAFIFIGFGFNDSQIYNDAIKNKIIKQECPALIITKESNERIEELVKKSKNLWLICNKNNVPKENTCICNKNFSELILEDKQLWDIENFTKEILGG